mgnify:CR=1
RQSYLFITESGHLRSEKVLNVGEYSVPTNPMISEGFPIFGMKVDDPKGF